MFPIAFFVLKSRFYYPPVVGSVFCKTREGERRRTKTGGKIGREEDNVFGFFNGGEKKRKIKKRG